MKKYFNIVMAIVFSLTIFGNSYAQDLKSEKIAEVNITTNMPAMAGSKIIYPLKGGTINGKINGTFLPVGGDFATLISPTNLKVDIRAVIQTQEGENIYVTFTGYIYADAETFGLLTSGRAKEVSPEKYYFRINPIFETTSKKYDWLNHTVAIGVGKMTETGVSYTIYGIK